MLWSRAIFPLYHGARVVVVVGGSTTSKAASGPDVVVVVGGSTTSAGAASAAASATASTLPSLDDLDNTQRKKFTQGPHYTANNDTSIVTN